MLAEQARRCIEWIEQELELRAAAIDAQGEFPADLLEAFAARGLFAACVPPSYRGQGLDAVSIGAVCEALGRASASALSLFTVHTMVSTAIGRWGTDTQRDRWLGRLADGSTIGALALTEPEAGSDVNGVQTVLRRSGDSIVVSGVKTWISFGRVAGVFLVSGKLDGQLAAVLVDRSAPGVAVDPILDMFGFRASMLARVTFRDCKVPATSLLGNPAFGLAQIVGSVLDHGRYCIAWGAAGLAGACLRAAVDYATRRQQFGRPLASHPLVQRLLTTMMVDSRAARLMCRDAARARDERRPDLLARTVAAKYFAARAADQCASTALQIHGANGLTEDSPVQRYLRDAKVFNLIEGSTQIQEMLLATEAVQWLEEWGD
jgi:hypothetical protein